MWLCLNGEFLPETQATISAIDRGFLLGDGLFESIRVYQGHPFQNLLHWKRLQGSASHFHIPLPYDWQLVQTWTQELINRNQINDGYLRITLSRGLRTAPGLNIDSTSTPTFLLEARPFSPSSTWTWSLTLALARRSYTSQITGHKSLNYLENLVALNEAKNCGFDEALFCVENDWVQEGTRSNLFMLKDDQLFTPPLNLAVLPGITRQLVLELFPIFGPVAEIPFSYHDLFTADAIFMTNSLYEIVPVHQWEDRKFPCIHPTVDQLGKAFRQKRNQWVQAYVSE